MKVGRRLRLRASILVDRPLEAFPAELDDPRSLLRWDRSVADVEVTSPGPLGVGSTFTTIGPRRRRRPGVRSEYRVLTLGPRRNRVELLHHPLFAHAVWTFEYTPEHNATRVTCSIDATIKRGWIVLLPLLRTAHNSLGSDLAALKTYIERAQDVIASARRGAA
jgi:hypothetical protein